ncbi:glycosyl transferase family 2 [Candidatus Symbiothrix dinenymphae]|nr:glycosyl transferase family 2 [Candidatus Symbiothrix dinenymphae]
MDISVVIPLLNEAESLPELYAWIERVMRENNFSYEVLFVDDGSRDGSWDVIKELRQSHPEVRGIRFQRNYGKSPALQSAFQKVNGNVIITMDADLQDSPNEIPELYRMIMEDKFHLVSGWKEKRYDPITKTLPTKLFNATARAFSGIRLHDFNCGLKAYRKDVVQNIEIYNDMHRWIPYLAKNAGYTRIGEKPVQHQPRKYGSSKFGFDRFFNGYLDLFTLWFLSRFGKKPMHFFGLIGTLMFLLGVLAVVGCGIIKWYWMSTGISAPLVTNTPYFYIALTCMIIGAQLFLSGFIGELITRNSPERNRYTVVETLE